MMVVQGVNHAISYIGVCYANSPQNGGYVGLTPAPDLMILFEVMWGLMARY